MNSAGTPAGTKLGWILVGVVLVALFSFGIFIEVSAHKSRREAEALGRRLISDFHKQYNSAQLDTESALTTPEFAAIQLKRPKLGKFNKVESCQIRRYIEPSSVRAKCKSLFEKGEAEESFIFRRLPDDLRLVSYRAELLGTQQ